MCQSKDGLMERLVALNGLIERALGNTYRRVDMKVGSITRRLILPGQILRFPDQKTWETFRDGFFVDPNSYDIITYTDPLGFNPGGRVYDDAADNPLNYLRRSQLIPMTIEMTSVFEPYITAEYVMRYDGGRFMPFLSSNPEGFQPLPMSAENFRVVSAEDLGIDSVISSYVPKTTTLEQASNNPDVPNPMFVGIRQSLSQDAAVYIDFEGPDTFLVPQVEDLSKPSVGCFWFNDGSRGQIELPKDPRCRVGVLVKFKTWTLL